MRFWERFSRTIFNLFILVSGNKLQVKSIESVLKNAVALIDAESLKEMRTYIISQQTSKGGFSDRAGKCDVYYSLFGCYVAEALDVTATNTQLKQYVQHIVLSDNLKGINLYCASILYAKLFGLDTFPTLLRKKVLTDLHQTSSRLPIYSNFLSLLTFYYLKDLQGIFRIIKGLKTADHAQDMPCPVTNRSTFISPKAKQSIKRTINVFLSREGWFYGAA